jgi:hypothetical protein
VSDWRTVRFDPNYEEPLDPSIIPLCDALQAAGFNTISSCEGHGLNWPHVWWDDSTPDAVCESLARYLLKRAGGDYKPFTPWCQKEILETGHRWMIEIYIHDCYCDTPPARRFAMTSMAILAVAKHVREWDGARALARGVAA